MWYAFPERINLPLGSDMLITLLRWVTACIHMLQPCFVKDDLKSVQIEHIKYLQHEIVCFNGALWTTQLSWLISDGSLVLVYEYKNYCVPYTISFKQKVVEKVMLTDVCLLLKSTCKMDKEQSDGENWSYRKCQWRVSSVRFSSHPYCEPYCPPQITVHHPWVN